MKDKEKKKREAKKTKKGLKKGSTKPLPQLKKETKEKESRNLDDIETTLSTSLDAISKRIEGLAKRMVQDTVTFFWDDTQEEEIVHFTKIWREFSLGIWGRSVDTISDNISTIMLHAPKGTFIPRHHHTQNQVIFVSEGKLRIYIDGEDNDSILLEENGVASIPTETKHSMLFLEQTIMFSKFDPRDFSSTDKPKSHQMEK